MFISGYFVMYTVKAFDVFLAVEPEENNGECYVDDMRAGRNLIKIGTRYILVHRGGETLFQPSTFTTYKPFPSFCTYAHVAITRAARFAADPIVVFDGPFVIIIQGRKPRSLLSYRWFHMILSQTRR